MTSKAPDILVLNGPNLDRLGAREPGIYGNITLADIETTCREQAKKHNLALTFKQSNAEAELISAIHEACHNGTQAIIINAAAFTHTSIAIRDALAMFNGTVIEIHLSNIHAREPFRHHSFIAGVATGIISGFGVDSYQLAIQAASIRLDKPSLQKKTP